MQKFFCQHKILSKTGIKLENYWMTSFGIFRQNRHKSGIRLYLKISKDFPPQIEPVKLFSVFIFYFYFRATCLFSSFRKISTEVICKAATEVLKFQRRLTRRKTIMLIWRHMLLWKENSTFLAEYLTTTRYCFVWLIKIIKLKRNL